MVISVKGGSVSPNDVRALIGTMETQKSMFAGFITLKEPTKDMREESLKAGTVEINGKDYPKCQIMTIKEMLEDKKIFDLPNRSVHKEKGNQPRFYF